MFENIMAEFHSCADEKNAKLSKKLVPGTDDILGIRIPKIREFAKRIAKSDWKTYLQETVDVYNDDLMLRGLVIGYAKMEVSERILRLKEFVPKINNWAICDCLCSTLRSNKKEANEMWELMHSYIDSEREYERRFALVLIIAMLLTSDHIDEVLHILNKVDKNGYYVKMAVAWCIAECFIKFPEKTMVLLKNNNLDDWTYNKGLSKITESYRIDDETKKIIKTMRR